LPLHQVAWQLPEHTVVSEPVQAHLHLRVVPNAARSGVMGWMADGCLKVKVQAPPDGGRANEAVCKTLAAALNIPRRAVTLIAGEKSRQKTLLVVGLSHAALKARLDATGS